MTQKSQWQKDREWFVKNPKRNHLVRELSGEDSFIGVKYKAEEIKLMIVKRVPNTNAFIKFPWKGFMFIDHFGIIGNGKGETIACILRNTEEMAVLALKIHRMQEPIDTLGTPYFMNEVLKDYIKAIEHAPTGA